jgi:hypothetical protein
MQSLLTTCMRRVYPSRFSIKAVTSTSWPVFPDGAFPAILAQESGHVGTTPTVPQDQTSGQAEEVPPSDSPAATGASVEAFPDGAFPAILAPGSGHVGTAIRTPSPASTTPTVPQDQTSGQAEEVPTVGTSPAANGASVSIERPPSPRAPLPAPLDDQLPPAPGQGSGADSTSTQPAPPQERPPSPRAPLPSLPLHDQGDAAPPTVQVEATLTVPPAVPESGGALAFSINVEAFEENGADFNWTLSLNGFKKDQLIYIYDDVKKAGRRVTDGVQIIDPAAQVVMIKARASLFDLSKQGKYEFR